MNRWKRVYYWAMAVLCMCLLLLIACDTETSKEATNTFTIRERISSTPITEPVVTERLSDTKHPDYHISLEVDVKGKNVVGIERVTFTNDSNRNLAVIKFHVPLQAFTKNSPEIPYFYPFEEKIFHGEPDKQYAEMTFGDITVNGEHVFFEESGTELVIQLKTTLAPNAKIELILPFMATIPQINHRTGASDKAIWLGNFFPTLAVNGTSDWEIYPYYPAGDPFFTVISNYTVRVSTPIDTVIIGTGGGQVIYDSETEKTTVFTAKLVRDFALAFGEDYKVIEQTTKDGIIVSFYYHSLISEKKQQDILRAAVSSLEQVTQEIGSYPYTNYSLVETGLFTNAGMEHAQLSFIDSERIQQDDAEAAVVHEVIHQWFYNVVGNNQVEESWLDEGLVRYLQQKILLDDEKLHQYMMTNYTSLQKGLVDMDAYQLTDSVAVYTNWSDYFAIHSIRAMCMLYSLENYIGAEAWQSSLRLYYSRYAFRIATGNDFIEVVEEVTKKDLTDFFSSWMKDKVMPALVTAQ